MKFNFFIRTCLFFIFLSVVATISVAQDKEDKVMILSERVGEVIDQGEREHFNLFPAGCFSETSVATFCPRML